MLYEILKTDYGRVMALCAISAVRKVTPSLLFPHTAQSIFMKCSLLSYVLASVRKKMERDK